MRMIKCNPQPVLVNRGTSRWLIPSNPDNLEQGGTYFTYPLFSIITGERISSFTSKEMSLEKIDNVWYWVKEE